MSSLTADDSDLTLSLAESGVLELGLVECAGLNFDTKAPFAVYLLAFYTLWRHRKACIAVLTLRLTGMRAHRKKRHGRRALC